MPGPTIPPPFGWTDPVRVLLIVLTGLGTVSLAWTAWRPASEAPIDVRLVIDPNTAPVEVLLCLPRLGPALVSRIDEQRKLRRFDSIEDLDDRVRGIGPVTIEALRPYLRIKP